MHLLILFLHPSLDGSPTASHPSAFLTFSPPSSTAPMFHSFALASVPTPSSSRLYFSLFLFLTPLFPSSFLPFTNLSTELGVVFIILPLPHMLPNAFCARRMQSALIHWRNFFLLLSPVATSFNYFFQARASFSLSETCEENSHLFNSGCCQSRQLNCSLVHNGSSSTIACYPTFLGSLYCLCVTRSASHNSGNCRGPYLSAQVLSVRLIFYCI